MPEQLETATAGLAARHTKGEAMLEQLRKARQEESGFTLIELLIVIVILGIAGVDSMRVFDIVWSMTQGGPFESSSVLAVAMYETSFSRFLMGQGAAFAVALLMLAAVVVMPYIYYLSSRVEDIRE